MQSTRSNPAAARASWRRRQQGAVAVIVGLSMTAMVAFVGLALDLGKLYVVKTELQNSADACALAAAQALTGANEQQLAIGEAAGMAVGTRHKVLFQSRPVVMQVDSSVEFSTTVNGYYAAKSGPSATEALAMRFARCTTSLADIDTWFIQVLNILPGVDIGLQQVSALAVATLQAAQRTCALPVAVCSNDITSTTPLGTWVQGTMGPSDQQALTGSFKWIDFTPPNGGASELATVLKGNGACDVPTTGAQVGQPGNVASLANEWNSRFGIYQGNVSGVLPDMSGFAYTEVASSWPQQFNAFTDFTKKRSDSVAYQGDELTGLNTKGDIMASAALKVNGRDRRLMVAPVVQCENFESSQTAPIVSWACMFLLHPINNSAGGGKNAVTGTGASRMFLEYRGNASDPDSPCASNGMPGGVDGNGPLVAALVR